ncbi:two-component system, OmpR family, sensor histidine kinase VanS [Actinopolymorpha cephalotaxi]|uniref:histidine kinase n=1 Tax=Actinopolymorpha cephalotaxi TaxID=504797 RepID=A0A1I2TP72_9ACTN|nr:two-component system, OmpR family, sensor histidine kinase VanS [Actinopolymorpha cephalotaxi]
MTEEPTVGRPPGLSVRLKLTLSYAGFLMLAGGLLLAVVWVFLLRYVPDGQFWIPGPHIPNRSDLQRAFAPRALQAMAFLLMFGLAGGWILAGRMLAPLTRITNATRKAATGSLSHRIQMEGGRDEFRELADAFDAMLEQLEAHVEEQKRFAANASHELRTPLAITQTLLEVARNDPHRDTGELVRILHAVNTRAIDLTEALLLLSRADQRTFAREEVDLSLLAEEATETLLPLAEKHGVTLETSGDVTPTLGSPALLLQMTTNLVHNAIVHNLPADGIVTVHTERRDDASVLRVENTGRRLAAELVPTLTEPFQRGTERARTDDHAGVGLGLAIVRSIVRAHEGTLDLAARPAGGLLVTVRLPRAPRAPSPSGAG